MLAPSAAYIAAIALPELKIAELYDVVLANGSVFRYTSHSKDIVWNVGNDTYTAVPIERNGISNNLNLEVDMVEIILANISGDLFDELQNNTLNLVTITIKRVRWDQSYAADEEIACFVGTGDISFNRKELVITCKSILDSLNIQVPRDIWQEPCNKRLYDSGCGLTQSDFEYQSTATTGTTLTLTDSVMGTVYKGIFDAAVDTLAKGETITGGNNAYTAVIVQVVYLTASTGFIWYVELSNSANFEDDEVLSSAGDSVTLNGIPVADPTFYAQGELEMRSGDNNGERRLIIKNVGNIITVAWPFPNAIGADNYSIFPGCDKTAAGACRDKFGNLPNFRGFVYIPKVEEVIT